MRVAHHTSVEGTITNRRLHGEEKAVWGDAVCLCIENRDEHRDHRNVDWYTAIRPGSRARLPKSSPTHWLERLKARVRAKVEHLLLSIKRQFGYGMVRYRSLGKNCNRLHVLAAFSNLLRANKYLPA